MAEFNIIEGYKATETQEDSPLKIVEIRATSPQSPNLLEKMNDPVIVREIILRMRHHNISLFRVPLRDYQSTSGLTAIRNEISSTTRFIRIEIVEQVLRTHWAKIRQTIRPIDIPTGCKDMFKKGKLGGEDPHDMAQMLKLAEETFSITSDRTISNALQPSVYEMYWGFEEGNLALLYDDERLAHHGERHPYNWHVDRGHDEKDVLAMLGLIDKKIWGKLYPSAQTA